MTLEASRFAEFYRALHGYDPFPWQLRLAVQVIEQGEWPRCIALPTAAGKTSCIDVALFALATQGVGRAVHTAPRRIFFVVDRRVIVQQAFAHAREIAEKLRDSTSGILREVADGLRAAGGEAVMPLDVVQLRGGVYRDDRWVRSPFQPTVIASTVDQVGSRLLFRGYGVSPDSWPIHAALVGNDSLILLDEAHVSQPFVQTLESVARYRTWAEEETVRMPFHFVAMTGTPSEGIPTIRDTDQDRDHPVLGRRLNATKATRLVIAEKAKGKAWQAGLVNELVDQAERLMDDGIRAVGVLVNRVQTARYVYDTLQSRQGEKADVVLLTGRMRNVDKERVVADWLSRLATKSTTPLMRPVYVVATQCLEVGADLDFHALVSECASLDALRQRFGRLNRLGERAEAQGVIVVRSDQQEVGEPDPIYGDRIARTWQWLRGQATADQVDMGVASVRRMLEETPPPESLDAPCVDAPVLLPAYLDCWAQTSPVPSPDPDLAIFLHGPSSGSADVQVVWRADLPQDRSELWAEIVAMCPPSSSEAMPVPVSVFRRWWLSIDAPDTTGDLEGTDDDSELDQSTGVRQVLRWRGANSDTTSLVESSRDIRPGETYILSSAESSSWDAFGHIPLEARVNGAKSAPRDLGEPGHLVARARPVLRLTPTVVAEWPEEWRSTELLEICHWTELPEEDEGNNHLDDTLRALPIPEGHWLAEAIRALVPSDGNLASGKLRSERNRRRALLLHPSGGLVLRGKRRLEGRIPEEADAETERSSDSSREVSLEDHCRGVAAIARSFADMANLSEEHQKLLERSGGLHDLGKADRRFQAILQGTSPTLVCVGSETSDYLAKSDKPPVSRKAREQARKLSGYPAHSRHELLSVRLVEDRLRKFPCVDDDLLLHLIATHHGSSRPFTPDRISDEPDSEVALALRLELVHLGESFAINSSALTGPVLAELNAAGSARFWRLLRRHGWWGLPYLESLLRLADWRRSQQEQEVTAISTDRTLPLNPISPLPSVINYSRLELTGLDGANPLAFLAALGTLRVADLIFPGCSLSWHSSGVWRPILEVPSIIGSDALVSALFARLHRRGDPTAAEEADRLRSRFDEARRQARDADRAIKERQLRGVERSLAHTNEVLPLENAAEQARLGWVAALSRSVPAPYLGLGRSISIPYDEFRSFARQAVADATIRDRETVDFAAAFASDACYDDNGNVHPTQFQLITGSGHQFFLETFHILMASEITEEKLRRSLFGPWTYSDPRRSFRWDPIEDTRYAYRWDDPSGPGVSTEHGANLLAAMALPFFTVVPVSPTGLATTGFEGQGRGAFWTWPIWKARTPVGAVRSLLSLHELKLHQPNRERLSRIGVVEIYRCRKIEVGRPPLSKWNFTPATVV